MQQPPGWGPPSGQAPNPYQAPVHHPTGYPPLHEQPSPEMQAVGLIVPVNVRNGLAFVSGYLGIGAFFCMGPLLGVPAIITGFMALKKPELGGQGRAWTGIVLGSLGTLWGAALIILRFVLVPHR